MKLIYAALIPASESWQGTQIKAFETKLAIFVSPSIAHADEGDAYLRLVPLDEVLLVQPLMTLGGLIRVPFFALGIPVAAIVGDGAVSNLWAVTCGDVFEYAFTHPLAIQDSNSIGRTVAAAYTRRTHPSPAQDATTLP